MRIAFFDSGIGGITVLHQAMRLLPDEDYLFYADTLHVPYGEKRKEEVRKYVFDAAEFIANQDVKALVVACNTATSIAVEDLRQKYPFPILGIEPAVKPAVIESEKRRKKVLVLATKLTLKEEKYHHLVARIDKHDIVDSLPLPGLVQFAEHFEFNEEKVARYLSEQLDSFDTSEYGTVVLGCTHFPYFKDTIKKLFPHDTAVIDGGPGTARNLQRVLEARHLVNQTAQEGTVSFYQSGTKVESEETLRRYRNLLNRLDELQTLA
ncbi:glutamate racemase [Sporolactobacillus sp. THM7-7]|nr:glutamate racemase [Sporolactobacillus sp. THM7-7]